MDFLLWHYRLVDSFWFIKVNEKCGEEIAEQINEAVWAKVSAMAANGLSKRFHIQGGGLDSLFRALSLFPWCPILSLRISRNSHEVMIAGESCPTQKARLRQGLEEFHCKGMRRTEFENFSWAIDAKIKVECLFAPPDPHPEGVFCNWRFTVG